MECATIRPIEFFHKAKRKHLVDESTDGRIGNGTTDLLRNRRQRGLRRRGFGSGTRYKVSWKEEDTKGNPL